MSIDWQYNLRVITWTLTGILTNHNSMSHHVLYRVVLERNIGVIWGGDKVVVFNATFNTISVIYWRSVLLVEETGGPEENHRPVGIQSIHWQTWSHNIVSSKPIWAGFELTTLVVISTDCIGSCKSNYHTIMTDPRMLESYRKIY